MPDEYKKDDTRELLVRMDERIKTVESAVEKQGEMIEAVIKLAEAVKNQSEGLKRVEGSVTCLRRDVDEIRFKPGRRWDIIITTAITAVVSGGIALMIGRFLGGK